MAMRFSRSGGLSPPWPLADDDALTNPGAYGGCGVRGGTAIAMPDRTAAMYDNLCAARAAGGEDERRAKLAEARDLLTAALEILDAHASSPAAATVDLAICHLDRELAS